MYQKKRLSQIFLHDHNIIQKMCRKAGDLSKIQVVEVGCGKGILSHALAQRAKSLDIVEVDETWLKATQEKLQDFNTVSFHHCSILDSTVWQALPARFQMIANIPYHLTSDLLERLVLNKHKCTKAIIMIQKEVAEKWVAKVGEKLYMAQSLFCQYHFEAKILFEVPKTCFYPQPKIDSAVIELVPKQSSLSADAERNLFKVIKSGFWGRRKTLKSCLMRSPYLELHKDHLTKLEKDARLSQRAETLSMQDFKQISDLLF